MSTHSTGVPEATYKAGLTYICALPRATTGYTYIYAYRPRCGPQSYTWGGYVCVACRRGRDPGFRDAERWVPALVCNGLVTRLVGVVYFVPSGVSVLGVERLRGRKDRSERGEGRPACILRIQEWMPLFEGARVIWRVPVRLGFRARRECGAFDCVRGNGDGCC